VRSVNPTFFSVDVHFFPTFDDWASLEVSNDCWRNAWFHDQTKNEPVTLRRFSKERVPSIVCENEPFMDQGKFSDHENMSGVGCFIFESCFLECIRFVIKKQ